MWRLDAKTYLVTGAGGDVVGAGVSRAILEAGGRLVVNDIDPEAAEIAAKRYSAILSLHADVSSPDEVSSMFAALDEHGVRLDGLVNNAGLGLRRLAHEARPEEFDRLMAVDVRGVWLVTRSFVTHLGDTARSGAVVNVASVHAFATMRRFALYAAAKSAVAGLTRGLAVELGELGIRCNAVAPGYVYSESNLSRISECSDDPEGWAAEHHRSHQALERRVEPEDCGRAAVFLLSEASRSITGQTLTVDAGLTAMLYEKDFT